MRVGVIGINHKLANLELRECLAKACQRQFMMGGSNKGEHTFVLLSTCNRTEVYFSSEDLAGTHTYLLNLLRSEVDDDFDQKVYSYFGHDCFLHLSRVTTGLDSAIVAETEIQGQVKNAYEKASSHFFLQEDLHYLFQKTLNIAKKVRSQLFMGRVMPGLEHAIYNTGKQFFPDPQEANILFVGASDINQKVLSYFQTKHLNSITLCNRSAEHAKAISKEKNIDILDWGHLSDWHRYNWIIFGTKSPNFLINRSDLPLENRHNKLIIDLCIPRNVDPELSHDKSITLLNIDQINHHLKIGQQNMTGVLDQAENLVAETTQLHVKLFQLKKQNKYQQLAFASV